MFMSLFVYNRIKQQQLKYLIYLYFIVFLFISNSSLAVGDKYKKYDFNSGLSDNHITDQVIDKNNFIWIATRKGLNKFDGYNYIYFNKENKKLPHNNIQSLSLHDNILYCATYLCVTKVNIVDNRTEVIPNTNRDVSISNIYFTSNNLLVIYYEDGWVYFLDSRNKVAKKLKFGKQNYASIEEYDETLFFGIQGTGIVEVDLKTLNIARKQAVPVLFGNGYLKHISNVGLFNLIPNGILKYNTKTKIFDRIPGDFKGISSLQKFNDSIIIIVIDNYKIKLYNQKSHKYTDHDFNAPANANIQNVNVNYDNILLGTNQGLIVFKVNSGAFEIINISESKSIIPRKIIEASNGNIYFFHYDGIYLKAKNYNLIKVINSDTRLFYSAVECGQNIYIGTEGVGLYKLNINTNKIETIISKEGLPDGIIHIVSLIKLNESKIIFGCNPGLYIYDIPSNKLSALRIYTSGIDLYKLKYGLDLFQLKYKSFTEINNEIWCSTNKGIIILDKSLKYVDIINKYNTSGTRSMVCDSVNFVYQQDNNTVWIATDNGFQKYNLISKLFEDTYTQDEIKSNAKIISIIPDSKGRLWMPTFYGLILFNPNKNILSTYHQHDGLVNEEYNFSSFCRLKNGNILLGGVNGYQLIVPERLNQNNNKIRLQITDILKLGEDNKFESLNNNNKINLNLESDFIQVRFSTNQYYHTESLSYYYRTDTTSNWISTNNLPLINISNLPRATNYLYIKVINNDNLSEQHEIKIPVFVNISIYKEWWFIPTLLIIFLTLLAFIISFWYKFSVLKKNELQSRDNENLLIENLNKEKELNSLKTKFIKLISHEYRTPLTGITTSVDLMEMLLNSPPTETTLLKERRHMKNIRMQVDRMSKLIKGVQSLNRMEEYISRINFKYIEVVAFVKYNIDLLVPSNFKITYNNDNNIIETFTDKDILQQIISNIISNSVKYSVGERKEIVVYTSLVDDKHYRILIRDFGIGISSKDIPYIYNTFYRGANVENIQGIGLGLSIAKQLIEQLNGEIDIQSSSEYGTTVSLTLPILNE